MIMMMKRLFVCLLLLGAARQALAWGQKGHDVVAYIAENRLTPEAAEKIDKVLGGHSPVYYANWMDNASHTPASAHTKSWHYVNIDAGETLDTMTPNPNGDVLRAVDSLVVRLKSGGLSETEEFDALRMLIHLVGDMHCPMHQGHLSDLGGNRVPVTVFGKPSNLHAAWDTAIVEAAHNWSYTEWQDQIDRVAEDEATAIAAGEPRDWVLETFDICRGIYDRTPEGTRISYDYVAEYAPVVEQQLLRGGIRLARLLNEIYR